MNKIKATLEFVFAMGLIALVIAAYYAYLTGAVGPWLMLLGG